MTIDAPTIRPVSRTLAGHPAMSGVARGHARCVLSADDLAFVRPGGVLVFTQLPAAWVSALPAPAAVVVECGGALCNAATRLRERGVPAVLAVPRATDLLETGQLVEVDGFAGTVRIMSELTHRAAATRLATPAHDTARPSSLCVELVRRALRFERCSRGAMLRVDANARRYYVEDRPAGADDRRPWILHDDGCVGEVPRQLICASPREVIGRILADAT